MLNPTYIAGFSVLLAIASIVFSMYIYSKTKKLMHGKTGADLEETFNTIIQELKLGKEVSDAHLKQIQNLDKRVQSSMRGFHILRYNPFPESGSNQSFAVAMLNESGTGYLLSSLYGRERMSVFAKQIINGKSEHELTPEEEQAVKSALESLK